jgi:hypothetical protein
LKSKAIANFDVARNLGSGSLQVKFDRLRLNSQVEKLMTGGGSLDSLAIDGRAKIEDGAFSEVQAQVNLTGLTTPTLRLKEARVMAQRKRTLGISIEVCAPEVEFARESKIFSSLRPLFFAHEFQGDWIPLHDASVEALASADASFEWTKAAGSMEAGRIRLTSAGVLSPSRTLSGWVQADYPAVKRLKWTLTGTYDAPQFGDNSKSLADLRRHMRIDDRALGLPVRPEGQAKATDESSTAAIDDSTLTAKTAKSLKNFGAKVIEKARGIVPQRESVED